MRPAVVSSEWTSSAVSPPANRRALLGRTAEGGCLHISFLRGKQELPGQFPCFHVAVGLRRFG